MYAQMATAAEQQLAANFAVHVDPLFCSYRGEPRRTVCEAGVTFSAEKQMYQNSSAVEWVGYLKNASDRDSGMFDQVLPLNALFEAGESCTVSYLNGAQSRIDDFALMEERVEEERTFQGNASRELVPFFNLDFGGRGVFVLLGWTGNWFLQIKKQAGGVRVRAGMPQTHFYLKPGEQVRTPRVALLFWEGEKRRAYNMVRRHLLLEHIPRGEDGEPFTPLFCNSWGGMKTKNHLRLIDYVVNNGLQYDAYWMDAGWHGPDHDCTEFQDMNDEDWWFNKGIWRVNRTIHPDGLKPVADAVHRAGMKFMLWHDVYTTVDGQGWHAEHPEWGSPVRGPLQVGKTHPPVCMRYININLPDAEEWVYKTLETSFAESGADYYREDSRPLYGGKDEPDRIGLCEMKAVEKLYRLWDRLREKYPGMVIDNCGGGGKRIDLETLSRSYVFWRTDYNCHPDANPKGAQNANVGLGHFIPLVNGAPPIKPGNTYVFRSALYGGMSYGLFHTVGIGHADLLPDQNYPIKWHRKMLDDYQAVKRFFCGDFYPLTDAGLQGNFEAYRFDRPDLGAGVLMTFRREECPQQVIRLATGLCGTYRFTNRDTGEAVELRGENIVLEIPAAEECTAGLYLYENVSAGL